MSIRHNLKHVSDRYVNVFVLITASFYGCHVLTLRILLANSLYLLEAQRALDIHPRLVHCWASVYDAGPTFNQPWMNISCLLGVRRSVCQPNKLSSSDHTD